MKLLPPSSVVDTRDVQVSLNAVQREVVAAVLSDAPAVSVVGAPGSGKTVLALELVRQLIDRGTAPQRVLMLAASRRGAGDLRNRLAARLTSASQGALVRTPAALAFSILTAQAVAAGQAVPRLITGPEQDQILAQLLAGYRDGILPPPVWPTSINKETLELRGFRAELRDLLMRAAENGLSANDLEHMGRVYERPEWVAGAGVLRDYQKVTTFSTMTSDAGPRYDPAQIVDDAAIALSGWSGTDRPGWDVIIVDDYQEATAATARLLSVLRRQGTRLVLLGDPDVAVQGFRGALPSLVGQASAGDPARIELSRERLGQFGARQFVLEQVYRGPRELREAVRRITGSIGSVGVVSHRRADTVLGPDDTESSTYRTAGSASDVEDAPAVDVCTFDTEALEVAHIARLLRSAHLRDKTPWTDMAVIARSGSALMGYRRLLAQAGVPVAVVGTDIPLRDEPAVRPVLNAVRACARDVELDEALDLLTSVIGGADAIGVRKLRRALRREELQGGGGRTSDQLIIEALNNPDWSVSLGAVGRPLERVARVLAAGRKAFRHPNATAQTVLWAVWDAAGLAEPWQRTALAGGAASARADRDLDAMMSLFRAAETYVDRLPESSALEFIEFIESQDIPADSLSQQVALGGKVTLVTPAGAAGRTWPIVVVAGVQEGQWPDLRLRDSLLGAQTLVEVLSGRSDSARGLGPQARREVFYDELRAFALSVARATQRVVVTAVRDDDQEPSVFLNLVSPAPEDPDAASDVAHTHVTVQASAIPLDLRGITALARAELMSALESGEQHIIGDRARLLRYLNERGVTVARPHNWYGALGLSSAAELFNDRETVPMSPSRVESVGRCALRWTLETAGGVPASGLSQSVGTLVHAIAAQYPDGNLHELKTELDRQWPNLRLGDGLSANLQYERAVSMIEKLAGFYSARAQEGLDRVEVEVPFTVDIEGAHISGIVDRLEVNQSGTARVIDLKTGKQGPTKAETQTNPQLGIYQLAVLDGAFEASQQPNGAALVLLGTSTKDATLREQAAITDPTHNWVRDVVGEAVNVMRSNTFTATRNDMCHVCPVRRSCPLQNEGQHVIPIGTTETRPVPGNAVSKEDLA